MLAPSLRRRPKYDKTIFTVVHPLQSISIFFVKPFIAYPILIGALDLFQIVLGADLVVLTSITFVSMLSLIPFGKKRWYPSDVLFLLMIFYNATFSLFIKTALLQPIDQNLVSPIMSSWYLSLGSVSLTLGYLIASYARPPSTFAVRFNMLKSGYALRQIAVPVFIVGSILQLLHVGLRPQNVEGTDQNTAGIGFLGTFFFLATYGLIAQATLSFRQQRRALDIYILVGMIVFTFILSVAGNIKFTFASNIAAVFLAYIFNGERHFPPVLASAITVSIFLFVGYASPLIHLTRPNVDTLSTQERLIYADEILARAHYNPITLHEQASELARLYASTTDPLLNYLYPNADGIDRFCLIQPIDQVARQLDDLGIEGFDTLSDIASTIMPSFLTEKLAGASPDFIAWYYGIRERNVVGRPVIGLTASALALGGWFAVFIVPALLMFLVFLATDFVGGPLDNSVAGVFVAANVMFLAEKEISPIISYLLRDFLIMILFLWVLTVFFGQKRP